MNITDFSDNELINKYFDSLDLIGADNNRTLALQTEAEDRDILFNGFKLWELEPGRGFTVTGCRFVFSTLESLKDHILDCSELITATVDGSMVYDQKYAVGHKK